MSLLAGEPCMSSGMTGKSCILLVHFPLVSSNPSICADDMLMAPTFWHVFQARICACSQRTGGPTRHQDCRAHQHHTHDHPGWTTPLIAGFAQVAQSPSLHVPPSQLGGLIALEGLLAKQADCDVIGACPGVLEQGPENACWTPSVKTQTCITGR